MIAWLLPPAKSVALLGADNQEHLNRWLTMQSAIPGGTAVLNQSASTLGWTCGNMVAPPLEVARFFWDLLGPQPRIVSRETLQVMMPKREFNDHWHAGSPKQVHNHSWTNQAPDIFLKDCLWLQLPLRCRADVVHAAARLLHADVCV